MTRRDTLILYAMEVQPTLIEKICPAQTLTSLLERTWAEVLAGKAPGFMIHEDGSLRFQNLVYVIVVEELGKKILHEGHNMLYTLVEARRIRT